MFFGGWEKAPLAKEGALRRQPVKIRDEIANVNGDEDGCGGRGGGGRVGYSKGGAGESAKAMAKGWG